jgi:tRNA pseudouridine55 synthase
VELTFGYATDTGDDTGKVISQAECTIIDSTRLELVLRQFVGTIKQIPPMHSAIKIAGKKLYDLARQGVEVERQPRKVIIDNITLFKTNGNIILFDVTCSKGTYIRSLCTDIGQKMDCSAVMSFLVRTRVGTFCLQDAITLEEIAKAKESVLLPVDFTLHYLPQITLSDNETKAFVNGQEIYCEVVSDERIVRVYDHQGYFIGIGTIVPGTPRLSPVKVLDRKSKFGGLSNQGD